MPGARKYSECALAGEAFSHGSASKPRQPERDQARSTQMSAAGGRRSSPRPVNANKAADGDQRDPGEQSWFSLHGTSSERIIGRVSAGGSEWISRDFAVTHALIPSIFSRERFLSGLMLPFVSS